MMERDCLFSSDDSAVSSSLNEGKTAIMPVAGMSNTPEYTVSEISGAIKRILEGTFGRVRVRGEITELKRYPSGHVYLSLKDERGKISGVIWRGSVSRLGLAPENGMEVIATGRISAYGERSSYQLMIDRMEFAGEGALLARIEQLRQKLLQEGLFDPGRKKKLPFLPCRVGVITSRAGAVLHDICTTISRRFPREILLWPVAVQGEGSAQAIAAAIVGMAALPEPPDVVIVARGGGALEDLMAFNDEQVVRAAAACPLPLISAVGHETDTTLIDFASDRRAPTPTAAAEMAVPLRSEIVTDLAHRTARLSGGLSAILQRQKMHLQNILACMPDLPSLLDIARMRLDDRSQRLELALPSVVMRARARLGAPGCHMSSPENFLMHCAAALERKVTALMMGWQGFYQKEQMRLMRLPLRIEALRVQFQFQRAKLDGISRHFMAVSPKSLLERGYVLVQDEKGQPVTRSVSVASHAVVRLHFADGVRSAQLDPERQGELGL